MNILKKKGAILKTINFVTLNGHSFVFGEHLYVKFVLLS